MICDKCKSNEHLVYRMSIIKVINEQFAGMTFTKSDLINSGSADDSEINLLLKSNVLLFNANIMGTFSLNSLSFIFFSFIFSFLERN